MVKGKVSSTPAPACPAIKGCELMSPDPMSSGWQENGSGLYLRQHSSKGVGTVPLDGPDEEYLRLLEDDDMQQAPQRTPEPIRKAYQQIAAAMLSAERFRRELPRLSEQTAQRRIRDTSSKIEKARDAYRRAELDLRKPDGDNAFQEADYILGIFAREINDSMSINFGRMLNSLPSLTPKGPLCALIAMRTRIAAILEVKSAPPRRVGPSMVIEGHDLCLTDQLAEVLDLALRSGGLSFESARNHKSFCWNLYSDSSIRARVADLKERLEEETRKTPFTVEVTTKGKCISAEIQTKESQTKS
jgi:hypothetical protein